MAGGDAAKTDGEVKLEMNSQQSNTTESLSPWYHRATYQPQTTYLGFHAKEINLYLVSITVLLELKLVKLK